MIINIILLRCKQVNNLSKCVLKVPEKRKDKNKLLEHKAHGSKDKRKIVDEEFETISTVSFKMVSFSNFLFSEFIMLTSI